MKPSEIQKSCYGELFHLDLARFLDARHPLVALAQEFDWKAFEDEFGRLYEEGVGRPGVPTRLMVGIHYLKAAFNVSDEQAVAIFRENPYWQCFCGIEHFVYECPFDRSSMTRWRQRIGAEKMELLLKQTFSYVKKKKLVSQRDVERVVVDTTVQEKAIAFPTDSRLYFKSIRTLVREARVVGIPLRQSYKRVSKLALIMQGRYAFARQMQRAGRETRKLRTYLGRLIREVKRQLPLVGDHYSVERLGMLLARTERIHQQKRNDKNKLYSVHAPEVECIAKGKVAKKYEFGCKVSVATTAKNCWVVGIAACHGNPFDGHTLKSAINQVEQICGARPKEVYVDRGYKGKEHHPADVEVHLVGSKKAKDATQKKWFRRRSSIEPIIAHLKQDNGMQRNYLAGTVGDCINAIIAGAGRNLRKILQVFLCALIQRLFNSLYFASSPKNRLGHLQAVS